MPNVKQKQRVAAVVVPSSAEWHATVHCTIRAVLHAAKAEKVNALVLGAFGCGAFGNPPGLVAEVFCNVLQSSEFAGCFDTIVFAIPNKESDNFREFQSVVRTWMCNTPAANAVELAATLEHVLRDSFGWTEDVGYHISFDALSKHVVHDSGILSASELGLAAAQLYEEGRWSYSQIGDMAGISRGGVAGRPNPPMRLASPDDGILLHPLFGLPMLDLLYVARPVLRRHLMQITNGSALTPW